MPETKISSSIASDLTNSMIDYSVNPQDTDGQSDQKETTWQMTDWSENLGYYKEIPGLQVAIDAKAVWTIGAGFTADPMTTFLLQSMNGQGKDTFNTLLDNLIRGYIIGGDSFAEIIRDSLGYLINLKPLDPSCIMIVINRQGQIIRYEQVMKNKQPNKKFKPNQIFHLSRKRLADEIHGISIIPSVKWIINARNEAMSDWKRVLHRNIDPLWIFHLDTDDVAEIAAFKTKMDGARASGENMYVPKGVVVPEIVSTAGNATLNPQSWIDWLNDCFFQAVNCPQIIVGNAKEFTDASGKIVYLSFEQSVKSEQLFVEENVLKQLNLEIALTFPASLQNELISDNSKAPDMQASQPNDTTAELEGKD
ncbi:MAG: phage portal protein [Proteobacteria bacterium]|nr:phage portal protein [Pseudomonadota bacterium]